ncbi:MAG TPA: hypothetical protein VFB38_07775 [Chthonomonadaceae bacterium]|nr:hypothetical protein [Chthonomonadaceae bacterium]
MSNRQITGSIAFAGLVLLLGCGGSGGQARAQTPPKADSGVFLLNIRGQITGTDTFTITADGGSRATLVLSINGRKVSATNTIKAVRGRMTEVVTEAQPGGKFTLTLQGGKGKFQVAGNPALNREISVPLRLFPTGNFMPHLLAYALANYDARKGGAQTFDFLLVDNGGQTHGALTRGRSQPLTIKGKPVTITHYALNIQGSQGPVSADLITDSQRRLLYFHVPSQDYRSARDGYQELAAASK